MKTLVLVSLAAGLAAPVLANEFDDLYRSYKSAGDEAPQWLIDRLYPENGSDSYGRAIGGDTYATAGLIPFAPGGTFTDAGSTASANADYDYTAGPVACNTSFFGSSFNGKDVVYTFTLPTWYNVSASTCGTAGYDTCLGIVDAATGALVAVNDDASGCAGYSSTIPACCLPGGTYYLVVDAYGTANGNYTLNVTFGADPCVTVDPCDEFVNTPVTLPYHGILDNTGAPDIYGTAAGDVGLTFTLAEDSYVELATCFDGTAIDCDSYWFTSAGPCGGGTYLGYNDGEYDCGWATHVIFDCTTPLPAGTYTVILSGYGTYEGAIEADLHTESCVVEANDRPVALNLGQNVPNPFNPVTTINFSLTETGAANLTVYDMAGHAVTTLVDGELARGEHSVQFDGKGLASGVYVYTLTAGGQSASQKMVLMK